MKLQLIPLSHVVASDQPRPLLTAEVDKLASSIKEVGLIQPITVMAATVMHGLPESGWKIVAGHHRVAACRALGWTEIDALVIDDLTHLQTELIEIDENLCRAELTAAQRTAFKKRREQIWEALHPDEIQVRQAVAPELKATGYKQPPPQTKGFAASTAEVTGESVRSVQRDVARANVIGLDALTKVTNTSLDSGVELDALAKLPAPERAVLIERAAAGEQVSARPAKPAQSPPSSPTRTDAPRPAIDGPTDSKLINLACAIKQALRDVMDGAGCMSIAELASLVNHEVRTAADAEIDAISDIVDYLEQWSGALCSIDVVSLAHQT